MAGSSILGEADIREENNLPDRPLVQKTRQAFCGVKHIFVLVM